MFYQALDDIKVLEYGNLFSAPFCAKILADLGAEVIKIEPPGCGDPTRATEPFLKDAPEGSGLFQYLNMNKLGITLDPATATGRKIFAELLKHADILVENNPPRRMKELGLTYRAVHGINPRTIMASITPFGQTGPYKDYEGSELVITHMGGVGFISTRESDINKEPIKYPAHLMSFQAGLSAAAATLGALYRQRVANLGSHLDISEQESVIQNLNSAVAHYWYLHQIVARTDVLSIAPAHILPCKDGYIYNAFSEEHQWRRFIEVMGHPDWADSELFKDATARALYWDALKPLLLEWTMEHTVEEIYRWSQERGAPLGAVRTADQVVADRQMATRGFFVAVGKQPAGNLKYPGVPYTFPEIPRETPAAAPALGEHNAAVYCGRLGFARRDLVKLKEAGVI